MTWACGQRNEYLEKNKAPEDKLEDCTSISHLLGKYGPDYNRLKSKLGYVRGLFEEGTDWGKLLPHKLEVFKLYLNNTLNYVMVWRIK